MDGWIEKVDQRTGRTYYYNKELKQTSWNKPNPEDNANENWVQKTDKNGKVFWYNTVTKVRSVLDPRVESSTRADGGTSGSFSGRGSFDRNSFTRLSFGRTSRGMSFESTGSVGRRRVSLSVTGSVNLNRPISDGMFSKLQALAGIEDDKSIDVDALASANAEPAEDLTNYSWDAYTAENFNTAKPKGFMKKGKALNLEQMKIWQSTPITRALVLLSHPSLDKKAVKAFKYIQMFMGDSSGGNMNSTEACQSILRFGIEDSPDELRDEIYCQLIKQLNSNPGRTSNINGWHLMAICVGSFPPGVYFESYLRNFIDNARGSGEDEVKKYAQYAKLRLDKCNVAGPREKVPTAMEINYTIKRKAVTVPVYLTNGTELKMQAETWTTIEEMHKAVVSLLKIKDGDIFCIAEVSEDGLEYVLPKEGRVLDVVSEWDEELHSYKNTDDAISTRFVFKIRLFTPIPETDVAAVELAYFQAVSDVTDSRYPCSEVDCIRLVALHAQQLYGDFNPGTDVFGAEFQDYLPETFEPTAGLKKAIMSQYEGLAGLDPFNAKLEYLKYVQAWPSYGCQVYPVQPENNPDYPSELLLAVNATGVFIIDPDTKEFLSEFKWDAIINWGYSEKTICLVLGDYLQQAKLWFRSEQPFEIKRLVEEYGLRIKEDRTTNIFGT